MMSRRLLVGVTNIGSTLAMLVFMYLFVSRNAPGLTALYPVSALVLVYALVYLAASARQLSSLAGENMPTAKDLPTAFLLLLCSILLIYVFLDSTVTDYYQPLSLYDDAITALALWWGLLVLQTAITLLGPTATAPRRLLITTLLALAAWPLAASLWWLNAPQPGDQVAGNSHVFVGAEAGYDSYRIPGLALIPAGARLASGGALATDRLLAFAEARRDGSLDSGVIDLVVKSSDDGGSSWSAQAIICRHQRDDRRGKCGNPTPVFDRESGVLILAYNLSGLESDTQRHTGHIMISQDGGRSWGEPRQITADNFVFGPGKGVQKARAPHRGRLLLPGYVGGVAHVIYSDDSGASWQRGGGLSGGDETDVAELADGRLYLASRHRAPISRPPQPNGRQFSLSTDGGASWSDASTSTQLPTPVCQASVLQSIDGGLLFSNPAHHRSRVRMSVSYSADAGVSWSSRVTVYPGPAGYSVLAQGSDGTVFVLYENGNMAYSERISLARIAPGELLVSQQASVQADY